MSTRQIKATSSKGGLYLILLAVAYLVAAAKLSRPALATTTFAVDRIDDPDPATVSIKVARN